MLHEALSDYIDTVVVDDPDERQDLTVQIRMDDGQWHRKMIGGLRTACGKSINYRHGYQPRHESYDGALCLDGCFSPDEVAENERLVKERRSKP
jgi:hypothetical protein